MYFFVFSFTIGNAEIPAEQGVSQLVKKLVVSLAIVSSSSNNSEKLFLGLGGVWERSCTVKLNALRNNGISELSSLRPSRSHLIVFPVIICNSALTRYAGPHQNRDELLRYNGQMFYPANIIQKQHCQLVEAINQSRVGEMRKVYHHVKR